MGILMRAFRVGILLLLAMLPAASAFGQQAVKGDVEAIGFGRYFRPDCWTPMLVNLTSTLSDPAEYDIVVEQEDLDSDTVVYKRRITLNAGRQDKFWVYFRPRTTRGSLPTNRGDLQRVLRVTLLTPNGKLVTPLPLPPQGAINIDERNGLGNRGTKLVLVVNEGGNLPGQKEYDNALGLIEDVVFVPITVLDLPENELGYEAVDAVLWLDADASQLEAAGSRKGAVLERWVREGGHLVVCQQAVWGRIEAFAPLLPVEIKRGTDPVVDIRNRARAEPLHTLATPPDRTRPEEDNWRRADGQYQVAYAPAKPDAVVERWIDWDNVSSDPLIPPKNGSPFIARIGLGLGAVTWFAQDPTGKAVSGAWATGWAHVWDVVFGWRNETRTAVTMFSYKNDINQAQQNQGERIESDWETKTRVDLGATMLEGTDHTGRAGLYVTLAVFFFIGYWIVAGPGSYVFLAGKGRKQLSWTAFALSALAATLLTVGVVRFVLRGDPEARHFSIARQTVGEPNAVTLGRVGLYIPRDGMQSVALPGVSNDAVSTLSALAIHPSHLKLRDGFLDTGKYEVPVRDDMAEGQAVSVAFPYRSTLKKIQTRRVGPLPGSVAGGKLAILPPYEEADPNDSRKSIKRGYIQGKLTNNTGSDLANVFVAFRYDSRQEWMLYVPTWNKGAILDPEAVFNSPSTALGFGAGMRISDLSNSNRSRRALLKLGWSEVFDTYAEGFANGIGGGEGEAKEPQNGVRANLVMMSLFDRIYPQKNAPQSRSRTELIRREGRELNLSPAFAAGRVVVLAEARDVPLPYPLEVEGDKVTGVGSVFYQFVVPTDRTKIDAYEAAQAAEQRKPDEAAPATPAAGADQNVEKT